MNFFGHERKLPGWYWTGKTGMRCLQHAIGQTLDHAYAHHIQRLMLTGNFALLAGIDPAEVDAWYLGVYIDAIEWVEMPNARGMSQFADGGIVGHQALCVICQLHPQDGSPLRGMSVRPERKDGARCLPFQQFVLAFSCHQPVAFGAQSTHWHGLQNLGQNDA